MPDASDDLALVKILLARMQVGALLVDPHGSPVFVNDALCRMTGFGEHELLAPRSPLAGMIADARAALALLEEGDGSAPCFEQTLVDAAGLQVPVHVSRLSLDRDCGEHGSACAYLVEDLRERKQLERALRQSEQRWRSITENPFDFVAVIDLDYRYQWVNHTAPGVTRESLIGKATAFDFTDAAFHDTIREAYETTIATGRSTSYDVYSSRIEGWYTTIVGPIFEDGRVAALSVLTREITAQKRAEQALRESEQKLREAHKMETIGTLAGGIAHDLNNILTPILAYSDLALDTLGTSHVLHGPLATINAAALRARDLVQQILLFSRRQEPQKCVLDLSARVRDGMKLFQATMPTSIEIVLDLPSEPVWVLADPSQVDQVVANLATNAFQAMREAGGRLSIRVRPGESGDAAGTFATLIVSDTGHGMDEDTKRRAFDPFFTTKPPGSGTGLGLSIVHGIVREHGGDIELETRVGEGAVFCVRLPMAAPDGQRDARTAQPRGANARLRVLCVDDEPTVARAIFDILLHAGHEVRTACSGHEALDAVARDPRGLDVLITDQAMPGMKGTALIEAVREVRPDLPCLLLTGVGDEATLERARAFQACELITKPFSVAALVAAVARVSLLVV